MTTLAIALGSIVLYFVAYFTYGRWLSQKLFRLDPQTPVPSAAKEDGVDFVPTAKSVVFGHHFTSIAGTGPIVGPALAIMWGWVPALLWVLFGSIFIGAVHDLATLVVSLRNQGMTVGEIAGRVINRRVRVLFWVILLFALWVVLAIFGWVIASVFVQFPKSILPVFLQIPIAVWIGVVVHRKGRALLWPSVTALGLMIATVWLGAGCPGVAGGDGGVEVFREAVEGDDVVAGGDEFLFEPEFFLEVLDLGEEADDLMGDGAEGGPGGFRGVVEVIEVDDFVFDEEVQLPAEEAAEVLVDEVIKGVPGGVVGEVFVEEVFVEEGAVLFLFGGALGGEFEEGAFGAFGEDAGGGGGVEVGLFLVLGGGGVGEGEGELRVEG